jgi:hypothetical protein
MSQATKTKLIIIIALFLVVPSIVGAVSVGQQVNFFVDPSYDLYGRKEISATLIKITNKLYFFVDTQWWNGLGFAERDRIDVELYNLGNEFEYKIYPVLTSTFGSEPEPGIDGDEKITALIHPMKKEAGGYYNSGDVYYRLQYPRSNEREIVYLNSQYIDKPEAKSFLSHEFLHLIIINQKDLLRGVSEETWLNEARAEYAPTLLGYDDIYIGSNLEKRMKSFLEKPSDSLTEWLNKPKDYGVVNLFIQYLVDHYGVRILVDSLHSSKVGIPSINEALMKNGYSEDFSQIFTDWTIAVLVNNCDLGERYCYLNKNLKDFRITPTLYHLPLKTESILSTFHNTTNWSANWHRFIGGGSNLVLEFDGADSVDFRVPYLLCDLKNICFVKFLILDKEQNGNITISGFNTKYSSLTIIPFAKNKISGFNGPESYFTFSWKASVQETSPEEETELIKQLLAQIDQLKKQIAEVQTKINDILASRGQTSCRKFEIDLYFGMMNSPEIRCLQQFLKSQGPEIYPEGLVSGNLLSLTKTAVIRFQEKYASEILAPLGLQKGTGYVGEKTRSKINQILGF